MVEDAAVLGRLGALLVRLHHELDTARVIVAPAHRGHGIGRLPLDRAVAAVQARGAPRVAPRVVLSTAARDGAVQRLVARAAFRPTMVETTRELADDDA